MIGASAPHKGHFMLEFNMPDDPAQPQIPPTPPATPPAAPPPAPAPPQTVTIPLEQLQVFTATQARLAQVEQEQRQRDADAQREKADLLVKKGEIESAMKLLREQTESQVNAEKARFAALEERAKRTARDRELALALAAQPLASPAAAQQLTTLFRDEFNVEEQGGSFVVRTPTFQSVKDFIAQQLARPEYAHFVKAGTQGGTAGATGGHQDRPTPQGQQPEPPKNMGEEVVAFMKQQKAAAGDPRTNMALPMGLKRVAT